MGVWGKLLGFGGAALVLYGISSARKESKALAREEAELKNVIETEKRRQNTPFYYPECISEEKFRIIAETSIKTMKRKFASFNVADGRIYGTIISQSGISEWDFCIDFNDFGKLTGEYWLHAENDDSIIPRRIAETVKYAIREILLENSKLSQTAEKSVIDIEEEEFVAGDDKENKTEELPSEQRKQKKPSWATRHKGFVFISILISIVLMFGLYAYYQYQKLVLMGYEETSLIGLDYNVVVEKLANQGFSDISTEDIPDLSLSEENQANLVTDIRLEGKPTFDEDTKYSYDKSIVIVYHSLKLCNAPVTSKEGKGANYTDVTNKFKDAGFVNVKTDVKYDIITGWLVTDGEVSSITIDGNEDFDCFNEFRPDAEVIITYHTLKKNDPDKNNTE